MKSIGERIKGARKAAGLTQVELAKKTKLSRSYIGDIEKDRYNPSVSTLQLIADATNSSLGALLPTGNSPDPSPESGGYYTDPDVAQITEELRTDPDKRILFDATKDLSKDDINTVLKIIEGLKAREKE